MTPRQIAERIDRVIDSCGCHSKKTREQIINEIEAIVGEAFIEVEKLAMRTEAACHKDDIEEAVAEEREECAKVAETEGPCTGKWDAYEKGWSKAAYAIANKIRARGKK